MVGDNNKKTKNISVLEATLALSLSWNELQAGAKVDRSCSCYLGKLIELLVLGLSLEFDKNKFNQIE